jgi:hypothetical protein
MQYPKLLLLIFPENEVEDMKTVIRKTWRELSEAASREQDPEKLLELVEQLNQTLEEQERQWKNQNTAFPVTRPFSTPPTSSAII